ncbi:hypothetical protein V6Z11_D12G118700 [Gossypium hirsutum]
MGWSIFPATNGIVCHNVNNSGLTQCRHPNSSYHVIGENEKSSTIRNKVGAMICNAVANDSNSVFSNTKPNITFLGGVFLKITIHFEQGHVGRSKVCTSTEKTREYFYKSIGILLREVSRSISRALQSIYLKICKQKRLILHTKQDLSKNLSV